MTASSPDPGGPARKPDSGVGLLLAGLAILMLVALAFHPQAHGHDAAGIVTSMNAQVLMDEVVHGSLAVVLGLLSTVMLLFGRKLGPWRFPVLLGSVFYLGGAMLAVAAAVTDGFVLPAIVRRCAGASPVCAGDAMPLLRLSALQIEALTRVSFSAIALAVAAWSTALATTPGAPRWAWIAGLTSAALQLLALFAVPGRLNPHSLMLVTAGQMVWYLTVALLMARGTGPTDCSAPVAGM
jgi:hypothetical protein